MAKGQKRIAMDAWKDSKGCQQTVWVKLKVNEINKTTEQVVCRMASLACRELLRQKRVFAAKWCARVATTHSSHLAACTSHSCDQLVTGSHNRRRKTLCANSSDLLVHFAECVRLRETQCSICMNISLCRLPLRICSISRVKTVLPELEHSLWALQVHLFDVYLCALSSPDSENASWSGFFAFNSEYSTNSCRVYRPVCASRTSKFKDHLNFESLTYAKISYPPKPYSS